MRQDDVIDIEQQVGRVRALMIDEERGIRAGRAEPKLVEKRRDALVVGERSNLKKFLRTHRIMVMHSNERGECVHVPS